LTLFSADDAIAPFSACQPDAIVYAADIAYAIAIYFQLS
jgi:hypothetical protein